MGRVGRGQLHQTSIRALRPVVPEVHLGPPTLHTAPTLIRDPLYLLAACGTSMPIKEPDLRDSQHHA